MPEEEETFLGVEPEVVQAYGRLAIAAGRLEGGAWWLAEALGLNPGDDQFFKLTKRIAQKVRDQCPPSLSLDEVDRWVRAAQEAMHERNKLLHSTFLKQKRDGTWTSAIHHLRSNEVQEVDISELQELTERLVDLSKQGVSWVPDLQAGNEDDDTE